MTIPLSTRDRARGALVGLACGDAVGTTVEFSPPGTFEPVTDMVGGGPFQLRPGEWTDDTSMALCMAESIVDRRTLDLADHHRRYLAWYRDGRLSSNGRCFDIGNTCASQLHRFERTGEAVDPNPDQESAANGSLMRLAPVPIASFRDLAAAAELSAESSRSTHPAQRPVDACRVYGAMIAALIDGADYHDVAHPDFWQWGELHPQVATVVSGSYRTKADHEIRGTGFCIDALKAALWAVEGAVDFRDAVLRATNLGDDADTTAAIAGQLAGARWGWSGIPTEWRERVVMADRLVSLADALHDLEGPAPDRWHHDDAMHAWWVEPGRLLAGEYPIDAQQRTHKLELLVDAGIRTFVDLTTPEDRLHPYDEPLGRIASERGLPLERRSFPIPDLGTVHADGYRAILDTIAAETAADRPVFVHCWGGVGRTGTVVGCHLVERGAAAHEVIDRVAELRHGTRKAHRPCPETDEQHAVVGSWGARST